MAANSPKTGKVERGRRFAVIDRRDVLAAELSLSHGKLCGRRAEVSTAERNTGTIARGPQMRMVGNRERLVGDDSAAIAADRTGLAETPNQSVQHVANRANHVFVSIVVPSASVA